MISIVYNQDSHLKKWDLSIKCQIIPDTYPWAADGASSYVTTILPIPEVYPNKPDNLAYSMDEE